MSQIGAHVSAAGGLYNAALNAKAEGLETFQMFSRPPQSFKCPELTAEAVTKFKDTVQQCGYTNYYVHAPYLLNLASAKPSLRHASITMLRQELDRGSRLGVKGVMFHTGSAASQPDRATGVAVAIKSLNQVLAGYTGTCLLLLENAAGSGSVLGCTFPELKQLYSGIEKAKHAQVGFCLDTQHAFGSGYDLRSEALINETISQFDKYLGLKKLICIQVNDSKVDFNSKKDRHEHIGLGKIGQAAFKYLLNHPKLKDQDFILETPAAGRADDVAILKKFRQI
ncbi:MAG: deoxyribonuclease IV [Patescibacteria group bacterium]|jgi:apurinic endonuclease APN1